MAGNHNKEPLVEYDFGMSEDEFSIEFMKTERADTPPVEKEQEEKDPLAIAEKDMPQPAPLLATTLIPLQPKKPNEVSFESHGKTMNQLWLTKMNQENNCQLRFNGKVCYPSWKIINNKHIKLEYTFENRDVKICFHHERVAGFDWGLKLSVDKWIKLKNISGTVALFAEQLTVNEEEAVKLLQDFRKSVINNQVWYFGRFIFDAHYAIEARWQTPGVCVLELKPGYIVHEPSKLKPIRWMAYNEPGFIFSVMSFMYFAKSLIPYIDAGIAMWIKMDQAGGHFWAQCVPLYLLDKDNEEDFSKIAPSKFVPNFVPNATPYWNRQGNPINISAVKKK